MEVAGVGKLGDRFATDAPVAENDRTFTPYVGPSGPMVRLEEPGGKPADFPVAFTFGVYPLQQYLVPFPGGRYQAIPFAWDARPRQDGGQRWFNLYPGSDSTPGDALHWTGYNHTWNSMCADCHSTGLRKGYDAARATYRTTWSDISVACEGCHGPGAKHASTPPKASLVKNLDQSTSPTSSASCHAPLLDADHLQRESVWTR